MQLTNKELMNVTGGAATWAVAAGIGAAIVLIIGVIDGYFRPFKCR